MVINSHDKGNPRISRVNLYTELNQRASSYSYAIFTLNLSHTKSMVEKKLNEKQKGVFVAVVEKRRNSKAK